MNSEYPLFNALLKSLSEYNPPTPINATLPLVTSCISFNLGVPTPSPLLASWK